MYHHQFFLGTRCAPVERRPHFTDQPDRSKLDLQTELRLEGTRHDGFTVLDTKHQ